LILILILICLLTAIGLTPGGSSTVHIDTQTIHRTTQLATLVGRLSGIRTRSGQTKINDKLKLKLTMNTKINDYLRILQKPYIYCVGKILSSKCYSRWYI